MSLSIRFVILSIFFTVILACARDDCPENSEKTSTNSCKCSVGFERSKESRDIQCVKSPEKPEEESDHSGPLRSLAIFGDSFGVGTMSHSTFERPESIILYDELGVPVPVFDELAEIIRAGRITEKNEKFFTDISKMFAFNPFTSFSNSFNSLSHLLGLKEKNVINHAVIDANVTDDDFVNQIHQIGNDTQIDLAVLAIGSGDLCADKSTQEFEQSYIKSLNEIKKLNPRAILLMPMLPVEKLKTMVNERIEIDASIINRNFEIMYCKALINEFCGITKTHTWDEIQRKRENFNEIIKSLEVDDESVTIIYANNTNDWMLSLDSYQDYASLDCFQPNKKFNKKYAEMALEDLREHRFDQ